MNAIRSAIVAGGGIGGLTAAHALQRAGISVRVVEIGKPQDRLGTGITLLGNAVRALAALDLAEACIEGGYEWERVCTRDGAGNMLAEQKSPRVWHPDRPAALGIMRPRLGQILEAAATNSGARIDFGSTIDSLIEEDGRVTVRLASGETLQADLVIAADGAYSHLRQNIFGPEFSPRYTGQGCWRYTIPRPKAIDGCVIYRLSHGRTVGALPLSDELCYLFILENSEARLRIPDTEIGDHMRSLLAGFTAPELVEAAEMVSADRHISYRPFDALMMPPPWHRGRVVLLGDAAHSVTPQLTSGGGMAIEDALVLAEELSQQNDVMTALANYSRRREPRVRKIFEIGLAISEDERVPVHGTAYQMRLLREGHEFLTAMP